MFLSFALCLKTSRKAGNKVDVALQKRSYWWVLCVTVSGCLLGKDRKSCQGHQHGGSTIIHTTCDKSVTHVRDLDTRQALNPASNFTVASNSVHISSHHHGRRHHNRHVMLHSRKQRAPTFRLSVLLFLLLLLGLVGLWWLLKHKASKHSTPPTQSPIRHTCPENKQFRLHPGEIMS